MMAFHAYSSALNADTKARILKAQSVSLNWQSACGENVLKTIQAHADAVGAPKEYIFFPLLTVTASFMGVNACMHVNDEWTEPAILWNVIAARKGEKKTAAMKRLLNAVEAVEKEEVQKWKAKKDAADRTKKDDYSEPPQLVVQQFSMEALHHTMLNNNSQVLAMYDEMSVMYGQLDAYKHSGSRLDRSTLLDLYNGGSWSRNFKNREQATVKMPHTAFNMCGFIQPAFIINMLDGQDPDAFNDRQFYICPKEVEYMYSDLKVPMDCTVPNLTDIFHVLKQAHEDMIIYTFDRDAQNAFVKAHDRLCVQKLSIADDEDRRGVLSKAKGQLARIAMVVHSLEQATLSAILPTNHEWSATILVNSVNQAEEIIQYIIDQKFALMRPEIIISAPSQNPTINTGKKNLDTNPKHLTKFLTFNSQEIQASVVSQFRLMPPTPSPLNSKNKYPVEQCKQFMQDVSEAGFGTVEEIQKKGSVRKTLTFKKRPFSDLGNEQRETLKYLKIDQNRYDSSLSPSTSDLSLASSSEEEDRLILFTPDSQKSNSS